MHGQVWEARLLPAVETPIREVPAGLRPKSRWTQWSVKSLGSSLKPALAWSLRNIRPWSNWTLPNTFGSWNTQSFASFILSSNHFSMDEAFSFGFAYVYFLFLVFWWLGFCWLLASAGFGFCCFFLASVGFSASAGLWLWFWLLLAFRSVGFWLLLAFGLCWLFACPFKFDVHTFFLTFVFFTVLAQVLFDSSVFGLRFVSFHAVMWGCRKQSSWLSNKWNLKP